MSRQAASLIVVWLLIVSGFVCLGGYAKDLDSHDIARNVMSAMSWILGGVATACFGALVSDDYQPHWFWRFIVLSGLLVSFVAGVVNIIRSL